MSFLAASALLGSSVSCGIATSPGAPPGTGLDIHLEVWKDQEELLDSRIRGQRKRESTVFGVPDPASGRQLRFLIYGDYSAGPTYFGRLEVAEGRWGPESEVLESVIADWELAPGLPGRWERTTQTTDGHTLLVRVSLRKDLASLSPHRLRSR